MAEKKLTYREAITEVEEILAMIENDECDVDILAEKVKRACVLIKFCKEKLHNTETEVELIFKTLENK